MKKVAFFDIDGTVFRSSLLIEVTNGLLNAGIFPAEAREDIHHRGRQQEGLGAVEKADHLVMHVG